MCKEIKKKITSTLSDGIVMVCQLIVFLLIFLITRYYFRPSRKFCPSIQKLKKGSLIVANHQSMLDPFMIVSNLPFKIFLKTFPVRFPTMHKYFLRFPFLAMVGAYDIGKTNRDKMLGLYKTRQYLIDGKSIMIFPEGHICDEEKMLDFKEGLTFLTDVAANVIFIRMKGFNRRKWFKLINPDRSLIFGEVQDLSKKRHSIQELKQNLEQLA